MSEVGLLASIDINCLVHVVRLKTQDPTTMNESCVQLHDLGPRVHPLIEIFVLCLWPRSRAAHRCEASAQLCRSSASPS